MGGVIDGLAFPAPKHPPDFYESLKSRPDFIELRTSEDECIPACFVRPERQAKMTILYSHGNAEDLLLHMEFIDALAKNTGANVFTYEYVGYSLSQCEGKVPSEEACIRSIEAAWLHCVGSLGILPSRIVIYGRSIGSGPSVDLASRKTIPGTFHSPLEVAGVLLQSPISSGARAVFPPGVSTVASKLLYHFDIYRNYEKIGKIKVKVAIVHGTADEVVNISNGKELYQLLANPFEPNWVQGYGHNNLPLEECFNYARKFLDHLVGL